MSCSVCGGKGQAVIGGMTMTCPGCRGFGHELPPKKQKAAPKETPKLWKPEAGELVTVKFLDLPEDCRVPFRQHFIRPLQGGTSVPVKWQDCYFPHKPKTYKGSWIPFDQGPSWVKTPADPTGKFLTKSDLKKAAENPRKVLTVRVEEGSTARIFLGGPHAKEFWSRLREERETDPEKKDYNFFQWLDFLEFKVQLDLGPQECHWAEKKWFTNA